MRTVHTRLLDARVARSARTETATFVARPPIGVRELPAELVEVCSPEAYREVVRSQIVAAVSGAGVPVLCHPSQRSVLGVSQRQWDAALSAVMERVPGALLGLAVRPRTPALLDYRREAPARREAVEYSVAYILVPAVAVSGGRIVKRYGFDCAIRLDQWLPSTNSEFFAAAVWNPSASLVAESDFERSVGERSSAATAAVPHLMEVTFPIDAVYTWVDGTDPAWLARKRAALETVSGERMPEAAADDLRFVGHDELRYSLRSLELYAPWIRHVYIVTDGQRPEWLREDTDWISIVDHRDIAPAGSALPTFNSQAIETNLHRIEGLSEHFLYFNDDMFLSSPVPPDLFFHANGLSSVYLSRAHVAPGPPLGGEPAPDAAGKNARTLIEEICGRRLARKLFHAPYALKRSVSYEIEERWPDVIDRTRDSQFRRLHDVTLAGGLHLNYAYAVGKAVTRKIRYRYVGIGELAAKSELERLMRDKDSLQTFCLNDAIQEIPPEVSDRQVREFLARRFPDVGSFERLEG